MSPPSELFWVRVENSESVTHLRLTGRFDSWAIPHLNDKVTEALGRHVVLDLGGLTFMDGSAWLAVMSYDHRVRDRGKDFGLTNAFGNIRKIFQSTDTEYLLARAVG